MNRVSVRFLLPSTLTLVAMMVSVVNAAEENEQSQSSAVIKLIEGVLKDTSDGDDAEQLQRLQTTLAKVARQLGPDHIGTSTILSALESSKATTAANRGKAVAELRRSAEQVHDMLTFKPTVESESPKGFPEWTPVGQIQIKRYPEYRMANVELKADSRDSAAFFTLFKHIKSQNIEMTAPVEMKYRLAEKAEPKQATMAFLYSSTALGAVGEAESGVKVIDVPERFVVSIGMRGQTSDEQISLAHAALISWLHRNAETYVADGELRVMGHNSPFVIGNRRYFEVQIPIRSVRNAPLP